MFHFLTAAALLVAQNAEPAAVPEVPNALVGVDFEAANTDLGCFALWSPEAGVVEGAVGYPPVEGFVDAGPLLDAGDLPFRTWAAVDFDSGLLSVLNGRFGVGFTPRLWLRPGVVPVGEDVGAEGTMRFEGTLRIGVRGTRVDETEVIAWERGFEAGPGAETSAHRGGWTDVTPVRTSGKRGPYWWTIEGSLSVDMHLYSAASRTAPTP